MSSSTLSLIISPANKNLGNFAFYCSNRQEPYLLPPDIIRNILKRILEGSAKDFISLFSTCKRNWQVLTRSQEYWSTKVHKDFLSRDVFNGYPTFYERYKHLIQFFGAFNPSFLPEKIVLPLVQPQTAMDLEYDGVWYRKGGTIQKMNLEGQVVYQNSFPRPKFENKAKHPRIYKLYEKKNKELNRNIKVFLNQFVYIADETAPNGVLYDFINDKKYPAIKTPRVLIGMFLPSSRSLQLGCLCIGDEWHAFDLLKPTKAEERCGWWINVLDYENLIIRESCVGPCSQMWAIVNNRLRGPIDLDKHLNNLHRYNSDMLNFAKVIEDKIALLCTEQSYAPKSLHLPMKLIILNEEGAKLTSVYLKVPKERDYRGEVKDIALQGNILFIATASTYTSSVHTYSVINGEQLNFRIKLQAIPCAIPVIRKIRVNGYILTLLVEDIIDEDKKHTTYAPYILKYDFTLKNYAKSENNKRIRLR